MYNFLPACRNVPHMHVWCPERAEKRAAGYKRASEFLELELQMVVQQNVGAGS